MMIRKSVLVVPVLALGLVLAVARSASAQETAADPHHPAAGAAGEAPAAAEQVPAPAAPVAPAAGAMPQDMMAMCPMMAGMMQQMMAAMTGQGMQGQGMMGQGMMGQGMMGKSMGPMQPGAAQAAAADPAVTAYKAANEAMMRAMMVPLSGKPDRDFVLQMIPHHQGAIDMARVQLEHGSDPQIRKIAEAVIAAQQAEIAELKAWLDAHPQ